MTDFSVKAAFLTSKVIERRLQKSPADPDPGVMFRLMAATGRPITGLLKKPIKPWIKDVEQPRSAVHQGDRLSAWATK
jgi:hypothetical protein